MLAIAHTKLDQFDKTWTNVKFPKLPAGFTKPFTREDSTSAKTKTIGATCKLFPLKNMKQTLQDKIRDIFPELKIQEVEQDQEEDEEEGDDLAGSQDFPGVHQSQGTETLKTCNTCNFQSRMEDEMINHMKTHYKCQECQKTFSTEDLPLQDTSVVKDSPFKLKNSFAPSAITYHDKKTSAPSIFSPKRFGIGAKDGNNADHEAKPN